MASVRGVRVTCALAHKLGTYLGSWVIIFGKKNRPLVPDRVGFYRTRLKTAVREEVRAKGNK